tara:strand:- start:4400 stop:4708 length:309 start_codon:yes stop_codon:yes gene_type:complete
MVLESSADLDGYFETDSHGVTATININGSNSTINVIFNREYFGIDPGMGLEVEGFQPVATGRTSAMPNVAIGDTITIESVAYNIRSVQPDGVGVTSLVLEDQ